jgi:signal transduction histidine kinase
VRRSTQTKEQAKSVKNELRSNEIQFPIRSSARTAAEWANTNAEAAPADQAFQTLARELHDGVLQNLVYLDMELGSLRGKRSSVTAIEDGRINTLQRVVRESIQELRDTLGMLREARDSQTTLQSLLLARVEAFKALSGARVLASIDGCATVNIAPEVAHHIDQIVQEALRNAWRHGKAMNINVALRSNQEQLIITVTDNGQGFDPSQPRQGHFGLQIMRERATAIGGRLTIASQLDLGTVVTVQVPWSKLG